MGSVQPYPRTIPSNVPISDPHCIPRTIVHGVARLSHNGTAYLLTLYADTGEDIGLPERVVVFRGAFSSGSWRDLQHAIQSFGLASC